MADKDNGRLKKIGKGLLRTSPVYLAAHTINERVKDRSAQDAGDNAVAPDYEDHRSPELESSEIVPEVVSESWDGPQVAADQRDSETVSDLGQGSADRKPGKSRMHRKTMGEIRDGHRQKALAMLIAEEKVPVSLQNQTQEDPL